MRRPWPPAQLRAPIVIAVVAMFSLSATACGSHEGQGGIGVPRLSADEDVDGEPVTFEGVLAVASNGCMRVRLTTPTGEAADRWAIWPDGAELAESGDGARVGDQTFLDDDRIVATGRLVDLESLPGGQRPGSYFEGSGRYCDAPSGGVLVIDEVHHA